MLQDNDVNVRLEETLGERLDDHLGDDTRGFVGWHKLPQPIWEGEDGEEPKRLKEHETVEQQQAEGEAEDEESEVEGGGGAEGGLEVGEDAEVDNEELEDEEEEGDRGPRVVAGVEEEDEHLHVRDEIRKVDADGEDALSCERARTWVYD